MQKNQSTFTQRKASRLLSFLLTLCMLLSTVAPLTLFAAGEAATSVEDRIVYKETFSSGSINTSGATAPIVAAGGFFACVDGDKNTVVSEYTLENDTLKFTSRYKDDYIDLRFNNEKTKKDLTQDFILSFWMKPETDSFTVTTNTWRDTAHGTNENGPFKINKCRLELGGVIYSDAKIPAGEWTLVEIVYHYDETATAVTGETGATTHYSFMLNGKPVTDESGNVVTVNASIKFHNINFWRFLQWGSGNYELDDLTVATGTESLYSVPRTSLPVFVYREEFSDGHVNTINASSAAANVGGLWINNANNSKYTLDNATLKFTSGVASFSDLRFTYDAGTSSAGTKYPSTRQDLTGDFTVSFWIKPDVDKFGFHFNWKEDKKVNGADLNYCDKFKVSEGVFYINGVAYSNAAVPKDQWSLIEIMYHFDENATAVCGTKGAVTSYSFLLNGEKIATIDAPIYYNNVSTFRMFRYANGTYELDDLSVFRGNESLYRFGRSEAPANVSPKNILFEDFNDQFNTDPSDEAIAAANGFYACMDNGSLYTQESGTLKFTRMMFKDYVSIQLGKTANAANMSQDFILSYKIRAGADISFRTHWMDSSVGKWEDVTRINYNRIYYSHDYQTKGDYAPGAYIEMDQWTLVEIAFHYDEDRIAVTGEQGAFAYYTVMINGQPVISAKTVQDLHKIDTFRLFYQSVNELEIDDLRIATGNKTLANSMEFNGYTDKNYFVNAPAITDYDYSFCVVGDPQCMTAWHREDVPVLYQWIADNAAAKKMQFVLSVGDTTQEDNPDAEWTVARDSMKVMNGVVPYSVIRGNHDSPENLDKYFNTEEYRSQLTANGAGGFFGEDNIENFWRTIYVGKDKYLIIGLDFGPTNAELEWACQLVEAYSDHKVIITTHAYLNADGTLLDDYEHASPTSYSGMEPDTNNGDDIWEKLGSKYANILMIISGHIGSDRIITRQTEGVNGNMVTQLLINPQMPCHDLDGLGMVAMLYFKEGSPIVSLEYYSTAYKQHFLAENQFSFSLNGDINTIVRHDFENVVVDPYNNGYGDFDTVANNGGLGIPAVSTAKSENGRLVLDGMLNGNLFVDLQLYACGFANNGYLPINRDFVLSFDVQLGSDTANYGTLTFCDTKEGKWEQDLLRINDGKIHISGANAALSTTEMTHVEVVFHYDENAVNSDSTTGAFTSFTLIVNGKKIGTNDLDRTNRNFKYINHFRMYRYWGTDAAVSMMYDNIFVGFGGMSEGTILYDVDFTGMDKPPVHTDGAHYGTGFKLMNYFIPQNKGNSTIANDIVSVIGPNPSDVTVAADRIRGFIDWNLNDIGKKLSGGDFTLSMLVRPIGNMSCSFAIQDNSVVEIVYNGSTGANTIRIKGAATGAVLSNYRFTNIEFVVHYDHEKMVYTGVSLYANGMYLGSANFTKQVSEIKLFRMFDSWSWNNTRGFEIDRATISHGSQITYCGETVVTEYIGFQTSTVDTNTNYYNVRLLAVMTDAEVEKYENVGFKVQIKYADGLVLTLPTNGGLCREVYSAVTATAGVNKTYTAEELGGKALFALNCTDISADDGALTFVVTTYYTLAGQDTVDERTFEFTVDPTTDLPQKEVN